MLKKKGMKENAKFVRRSILVNRTHQFSGIKKQTLNAVLDEKRNDAARHEGYVALAEHLRLQTPIKHQSIQSKRYHTELKPKRAFSPAATPRHASNKVGSMFSGCMFIGPACQVMSPRWMAASILATWGDER
jgi:hypothetical protein